MDGCGWVRGLPSRRKLLLQRVDTVGAAFAANIVQCATGLTRHHTHDVVAVHVLTYLVNLAIDNFEGPAIQVVVHLPVLERARGLGFSIDHVVLGHELVDGHLGIAVNEQAAHGR